MNYLVVGGSSVSGQSIIKGIGELDSQGRIWSTTSSDDRQVEGAHDTIGGIDLADADAVDKILEAIRAAGPGDFAAVVYIPARGQVGMPTSRATREMVSESVDYSIRPMLRLAQALKPKTTICLSGFITMEPMLECYGAMAYTKLIMEDMVVRYPEQLKTIRLGMFPSNSVRGIAILTQKNLMRNVYPENQGMADEWRASGKKFSDFFYGKNWHYEETIYRDAADFKKPFRATTADDIRLAVKQALNGEKAPIINVLGDWVWTEDKMPPLPQVVQDQPEFMKTDLDQYMKA